MPDHGFTDAQVEGILDLFMEDPDDPDGCWTWLGRIDDDGYGRYGPHLAHRAVYQIMVGPIPDGHDLDHNCVNRLCVRPMDGEHTEPVTHEENIRRRDEAARARERGER